MWKGRLWSPCGHLVSTRIRRRLQRFLILVALVRGKYISKGWKDPKAYIYFPLAPHKNKKKQTMTDDLRISKTTAYWLIKVCTKMVRDGLGRPNWAPLGTQIDRFSVGYLQIIYERFNGESQDPRLNAWVESLVAVARVIAASLAFQVEPEVVESLVNFDDLDISDIE